MNSLPVLTRPPARYSMSKYLRNLRGLLKKDPLATPLPSKLKELFEKYRSEGAIINKIIPGRFFLKNGLPYEGFVTTESLGPNELILRIPQKLCLSTRHAFLSELIKIYRENPAVFWNYDEIDEDHILIPFLLNELAKGEKSAFYDVISVLPRDQDVLAMWPADHLALFEDPELSRRVAWRQDLMKKSFDSMNEVLVKYPDVFDMKVFTYENFAWMYCLLLNRCFGKKNFGFVQMIPIAELLNHDCTETHYNIMRFNEERKEVSSKYTKEEETLDEYSTDHSSQDQQSDWSEDFYDTDYLESVNGETDFKHQINHGFLDFLKENFALHELSSLLFAYKIMVFSMTPQANIEELKSKSLYFKENLEELWKSFLHAKSYKDHADSMKYYDYDADVPPEPSKEEFFKNITPDPIEAVDFRTGAREFIEPSSQLFFCYGYRSNRTLIHNYGMCIEYNRYDSVFLKLDCREYHCFEEQIIREMVGTEMRLPKFKRFKIKYTRFNREMLSFFKLMFFDFAKDDVSSIFKPNNWELELIAIDGILDVLENTGKTKLSLNQNEEILKDKNTGYHEYFAAVYRVEKLRIIEFQKKLFNVYREIVLRRKKGEGVAESVRRVEEFESEEECMRHRYVMYDYLKMM